MITLDERGQATGRLGEIAEEVARIASWLALHTPDGSAESRAGLLAEDAARSLMAAAWSLQLAVRTHPAGWLSAPSPALARARQRYAGGQG